MQRLERAEQRLKAAEYLLEGGFHEDSISRSYYSMFHAAKALLESEDIRAKTHKGVIRMLGENFVKTDRLRRSLGKAFSMAEEDRETADYDIQIEFTEEEARERLEDAIKISRRRKKHTRKLKPT